MGTLVVAIGGALTSVGTAVGAGTGIAATMVGGALVGAATGSLIAAVKGDNILKGALIGGTIGGTLGAATGPAAAEAAAAAATVSSVNAAAPLTIDAAFTGTQLGSSSLAAGSMGSIAPTVSTPLLMGSEIPGGAGLLSSAAGAGAGTGTGAGMSAMQMAGVAGLGQAASSISEANAAKEAAKAREKEIADERKYQEELIEKKKAKSVERGPIVLNTMDYSWADKKEPTNLATGGNRNANTEYLRDLENTAAIIRNNVSLQRLTNKVGLLQK